MFECQNEFCKIISIEETDISGTKDMGINHHHPFIENSENIPDGTGITDNDNVKARFVGKAMTHALKRANIVNDILGGYGYATSTVIPLNMKGKDTS